MQLSWTKIGIIFRKHTQGYQKTSGCSKETPQTAQINTES